jgi:hypothetical protein
MSGTGKTAVANIVGCLDRVQPWRIDCLYEFFCGLHFLGSLTLDAAVAMVRMSSDMACYNTSISRDANFRPGDHSSVLKNHLKVRSLERLLLPDGKAAVDRIETENHITHLVTHQMLGIARPIFDALADRLVYVHCIRHPLFLLEHWMSYIDRYGEDRQDFTLWTDFHGKDVPWFASGKEEEFFSGSKMDRVIWSLCRLEELKRTHVSSLSEDIQKKIISIPFERFVKNPDPFILQLETALETKVTKEISEVLRVEKIPRSISTAGPDSDIWRRYGHKPPDDSSSEQKEFFRAWELASQGASASSLKKLEELSNAFILESEQSLLPAPLSS